MQHIADWKKGKEKKDEIFGNPAHQLQSTEVLVTVHLRDVVTRAQQNSTLRVRKKTSAGGRPPLRAL